MNNTNSRGFDACWIREVPSIHPLADLDQSTSTSPVLVFGSFLSHPTMFQSEPKSKKFQEYTLYIKLYDVPTIYNDPTSITENICVFHKKREFLITLIRCFFVSFGWKGHEPSQRLTRLRLLRADPPLRGLRRAPRVASARRIALRLERGADHLMPCSAEFGMHNKQATREQHVAWWLHLETLFWKSLYQFCHLGSGLSTYWSTKSYHIPEVWMTFCAVTLQPARADWTAVTTLEGGRPVGAP